MLKSIDYSYRNSWSGSDKRTIDISPQSPVGNTGFPYETIGVNVKGSQKISETVFCRRSGSRANDNFNNAAIMLYRHVAANERHDLTIPNASLNVRS